jgi:hypothetical protein
LQRSGKFDINILARKSEEVPFPQYKTGVESGGNSKPNPLVSLLFNSLYQLQRHKNYDFE